MTQRKALVIVPTYNESATIATVVERLFAAAGDQVALLVVDDNSADGTAAIVSKLAGGEHEIHLLQRPGKLGLGTAYVAGFKWALENGYRRAVEMDADLSHDPADVPRLVHGLDGADVVIGSRYVPGGRIENWSTSRRLLSRGGNIYVRLLLGFGVRDSTSGFRAYSAEFLSKVDLDSVRSEGFGFQIEMTRRAYLAGARISEQPIKFVEREAGKSKMSRSIIVEALSRVTAWGLRDRLDSLRGRPH